MGPVSDVLLSVAEVGFRLSSIIKHWGKVFFSWGGMTDVERASVVTGSDSSPGVIASFASFSRISQLAHHFLFAFPFLSFSRPPCSLWRSVACFRSFSLAALRSLEVSVCLLEAVDAGGVVGHAVSSARGKYCRITVRGNSHVFSYDTIHILDTGILFSKN